jgi:hypothetical protein
MVSRTRSFAFSTFVDAHCRPLGSIADLHRQRSNCRKTIFSSFADLAYHRLCKISGLSSSLQTGSSPHVCSHEFLNLFSALESVGHFWSLKHHDINPSPPPAASQRPYCTPCSSQVAGLVQNTVGLDIQKHASKLRGASEGYGHLSEHVVRDIQP